MPVGLLCRRCCRSMARFPILQKRRQVNATSHPKTTTSRDVPIAYGVYPDKGKKVDKIKTPLVCSHGLLGFRRDVECIAQYVSGHGRKVITYDARNHGDSGRSPDMSYRCMSDDLFWLIQHLNLTKPICMGHSMTGKAAMMLALTRQDSMRALIVEDAVPGQNPGVEIVRGIAMLLKSVNIPEGASLDQAMKEADAQLQPAVPDSHLREFLVTNLKQHEDGKVRWRTDMDAIIAQSDVMGTFPEYKGKPFEKPTLFVYGETSEHYKCADMARIKELFPNSEVKVIQGAGHFIHDEKPLEVSNTINLFCETIDCGN